MVKKPLSCRPVEDATLDFAESRCELVNAVVAYTILTLIQILIIVPIAYKKRKGESDEIFIPKFIVCVYGVYNRL